MVDRDELLHRAAALVPALRERAAQTEELRHIPQETVDDFHASGILKASQPARFGGYEIDYPIVLDIAAELGRGCGSSSWCYSIWASHNWLAGMFPEKAQQEYWADSADVLSSTSFNPTRAKVVEIHGGYKLSGHWDFSSGCDAAAWAMLGGMTSDGLRWFLIPRSDYTIEDTWFVSGLRGTGSKDIVIEETFVPEHRAGNVAAMREGQSPGRELHGSCNYQIPHTSMLSYTLAAPVLGIAQGALETFEEQVMGRTTYTTGEKLGENSSVHIRLSEDSLGPPDYEERRRRSVRTDSPGRDAVNLPASPFPPEPGIRSQAVGAGSGPVVRGQRRPRPVQLQSHAAFPPRRPRRLPPLRHPLGDAG